MEPTARMFGRSAVSELVWRRGAADEVGQGRARESGPFLLEHVGGTVVDRINGFFAVRMPSDVRRQLEAVSETLRDEGVTGDWQSERSHHLTLKYIGEIDPDEYDEIAAALREPCGELYLPEFSVGPLFTFDAPDSKVLAARVRPRDELVKLFDVLERTVVENGGPPSKFPSHKPHVTLCYLDEPGNKAWELAKSDLDIPDMFGKFEIKFVPANESEADGDDFRTRRRVRVGCSDIVFRPIAQNEEARMNIEQRAKKLVRGALEDLLETGPMKAEMPHAGDASDDAAGHVTCPSCGSRLDVSLTAEEADEAPDEAAPMDGGMSDEGGATDGPDMAEGCGPY